MRKIKRLVFMLVLAALAFLVWTWDRTEPDVDWLEAAPLVGPNGTIRLRVFDQGKGLRSIQVAAVQSGQRRVLLSESFPGLGLPWEDPVFERSFSLQLDSLPETELLREGDFELEVVVRDQPNLGLFSREKTARQGHRLDLSPPQIEILSGRHYIRQGGSEAILYRLSEEIRASGVRVGQNLFRGYLQDSGYYLCLFALGHDQAQDTEMRLWAEDLAGNRVELAFPKEVIPVRFRKRTITVSDRFIEKVAADILPRTDQVSRKDTPLETFLEINAQLREFNHEQITELSRSSADRILWSQPFLQLSNSQVESSFADARTYLYEGKPIDHQTHLGFDLASLANSRVECSNDGTVLWAGYLGIYGNCILVDHGLGLISLYGHLSSVAVEEGQKVERGQTLGRTGETGLAGGDHLHFSMVLQGVQVNPLEWWDPEWLDRHIFARLGGSHRESG